MAEIPKGFTVLGKVPAPIRAQEGLVNAQGAIGQALADVLTPTSTPTPTFQGLLKEGDAVAESGQKLVPFGAPQATVEGGSPFLAAEEVEAPEAFKAAPLQMIGFAVAGPPGAMLGEFINQKLGFSSGGLPSIGLAGVAPGAGKLIGGVSKSITRGIAGFIAPAATRRAGSNVVKQQFGATVPKFRFSGTGADTPPSSVLFEQAAKAGPISTLKPRAAVQRALAKEANMSSPNARAIKRLSNLEAKLGSSPTIEASDFIDELQRIRQVASAEFGQLRGDPTVGKTLEDAAKSLIDSAPPQYKKALQVWKRETSLNELLDELSSSNTTVAFQKMIRNDPIMKTAFNKQELFEIEKIADAIGAITTGGNVGGANRMMNSFLEIFRTMLNTGPGRSALRALMRDPDMTAGNLAAAMGQILGLSGRDVLRRMFPGEQFETPPDQP